MRKIIQESIISFFAVTVNVFDLRIDFKEGGEIIQLRLADGGIQRALANPAGIDVPKRDPMFQHPEARRMYAQRTSPLSKCMSRGQK